MVTGRVGSGIAAELGSMMVTEQIAALRSLGTDPIRKLVVPRVVAGTVMLPVLTVISDAMGIGGGAVISRTQLKIAGSVYWNNVVQGLYMQDVDGPDQAGRARILPDDHRLSSDCARPAARGASAGPPPMRSSPGRSSCWRSISS
jgi:hypothetical protein